MILAASFIVAAPKKTKLLIMHTLFYPKATYNHKIPTHIVPRSQNVRLDPPVCRGTLAAEVRHRVHVPCRQPVRARHARPHGQAILTQGRRRDAAPRHVVTEVAGSKHQQMLRVLRQETYAGVGDLRGGSGVG